jgi:capsular polysaccharide biosynthesis protein
MDFWTGVQVLKRQWKAWLAGLLITAVAAAGAFLLVKPKYVATSDNLMLLPTQSGVNVQPYQANPYLNISAGLTVTAETMIQAMNGDATLDALTQEGAVGKYTAIGFMGDAPLVTLQVEAGSDQDAMRGLNLYGEQLRKQLAQLQQQAQVPPEQIISAVPVRYPVASTKDSGSRTRALIGVIAVGAILSIFAAFLAEQRRRNRVRAQARELSLANGDAHAHELLADSSSVQQ